MELNLDEHPEFDRVKHAVYVAKGYCSSVHVNKCYCCLPTDHEGAHTALRLMPDGRLIVGTRWH